MALYSVINVGAYNDSISQTFTSPDAALTHAFEYDDDNWTVEKITASIDRKGEGKFYKVKWVRYIWQAEETIQPLQHLIDKYWQEYSVDTAELLTQGIRQQDQPTQSFSNHIDHSQLSEQYNLHKQIHENMDHLQDYYETNTPCSDLNDHENVLCNDVGTGVGIAESLHATQSQVLDNQTGDILEVDVSSPLVNFGYKTPLVKHSHEQSLNEDDGCTKGILQNFKQHGKLPEDLPASNFFSAKTDDVNEYISSSDKVTSSSSFYEEHVTSEIAHSNELPTESIVTQKHTKEFICNICKRAFNRNSSLKRHSIIHSGVKSWRCEYCNKPFNQKAVLIRHLKSHTEKKSYKCPECSKSFVENAALLRHQAVHKSEKDWFCDICGKRFVIKEYLRKHLLIHSGEKPYRCYVCSKRFVDCSALRRHEKTHL